MWRVHLLGRLAIWSDSSWLPEFRIHFGAVLRGRSGCFNNALVGITFYLRNSSHVKSTTARF